MFFKKKEQMIEDQRTIDFTKCMWGHSCSVERYTESNMIVDMSGHSSVNIKRGDHILLKSSNGYQHGVRYKVINITFCKDPHDMFFAKCIFANTQTKEDIETDATNIQNRNHSWKTATPTTFKTIKTMIKEHTGVTLNDC